VTPARLIAIVAIFICTTLAWAVLGGSVVARTGDSDARLSSEVQRLWGGQHEQLTPTALVVRPRQVTDRVIEKDPSGQAISREVTKTVEERSPIAFDQARLTVGLESKPRRKGLLWFATYGVSFNGRYRFRNPDSQPRAVDVHFAFPSTQALFDAFRFSVNGHEIAPSQDLSQGVTTRVEVPPAGEAVVDLRYHSQGVGTWTYAFAPAVTRVLDLQLDLTTNFTDIDFPPGTIPPAQLTRDGGGAQMRWGFESLVTGQKIGIIPPQPINPGPLASRITFFAPVSLLFFVTVLVILGVVRGPSLHPMHYFFLSAAFFAFHLLLAYLVDHLNVHLSFAVAAAASVFLVVTYLRVVAGTRFALREAGLAQVLFLVLFSYAFFFEGYTGLAVTIGAVLTLFVLMQVTARVDWAVVFAGSRMKTNPVDRIPL
jgi:Inner membrane protein CreD